MPNKHTIPTRHFTAGIVRASAVAIPESLQLAAADLRPVANGISAKDVSNAAEMLGIFSGALDTKKFQPYSAVANIKVQPLDAPTEKNIRISLGFLSRIGEFLARQRMILDRLNALLPAKSKKADKPLPGEPAPLPPDEVSDFDTEVPIEEVIQQAVATSTPVVQQPAVTTISPTLSAEALKQVVADEGFLESGVADQGTATHASKEEALKTDNLGIDLSAAIGAPPPPATSAEGAPLVVESFLAPDALPETQHSQEKLSPTEIKALKRQLKEQQKQQEAVMAKRAKREKKEEDEWRKEAERREKLLATKKAQAKKEEDTEVDLKSRIAAKRALNIKKQSKVQQILTALNYMGMEKERVAFIDNLGTMMEAGLPLLDAVRSLLRETRNRQMRKLLGRMVVAVETGSPLWRAMDAQYFFHQQQIAMVKVGEEAGNLVDNLKYLAEQERKDRNLRGKVKTAMIYPSIILVMLTVIILGLGMFVLPNLVQVIFSLGVPLPFITRVIIKFTNLFTVHGSTVIPSVFIGMIVFVVLAKFTSFKIVVQWVLFKLPGIGALLREATLSRFGVIMGGLLRAGVPVTDALQSIANVTTLARYRKFYFQLLERVRLGDSFATSFRSIKLTDKCFPASLQQLVVTGEQSGSLTKIMLKTADIHDRRATEIAEKLPVILEPLLLMVIGCMVGAIALGILMPIYSVVGNVGGG